MSSCFHLLRWKGEEHARQGRSEGIRPRPRCFAVIVGDYGTTQERGSAKGFGCSFDALVFGLRPVVSRTSTT